MILPIIPTPIRAFSTWPEPTPVASLNDRTVQGNSIATFPFRGAAVLPWDLLRVSVLFRRVVTTSSSSVLILRPLLRSARTEAISARPLPRISSSSPRPFFFPFPESGPPARPSAPARTPDFMSVSFCLRSRSTFSASACSGATRPVPPDPESVLTTLTQLRRIQNMVWDIGLQGDVYMRDRWQQMVTSGLDRLQAYLSG